MVRFLVGATLREALTGGWRLILVSMVPDLLEDDADAVCLLVDL